jgi:hypothetical protein
MQVARAAPKTAPHGDAHEVRHRVGADASAARIVAVEPKGDAHRCPFTWSPHAIEKLMSPRPRAHDQHGPRPETDHAMEERSSAQEESTREAQGGRRLRRPCPGRSARARRCRDRARRRALAHAGQARIHPARLSPAKADSGSEQVTGANGRRRVVITGLGAVTPLASEIATSWQWLIGGRSAAAAIKSFDASGFALGVSETLVPALPTEREMSSRWLYRTFNTSAPKQHA